MRARNIPIVYAHAFIKKWGEEIANEGLANPALIVFCNWSDSFQ